jgi:hypothetical protein
MSLRRYLSSHVSKLLALTPLLAALVASTAQAQFLNQQVGGVSIDADGVLSNIQTDQLNALKQFRQDNFTGVPGALKDKGLRKISLRGLEAAIAEHQKAGTPLTDEIRYLGGLQRIQYVFVYPERGDIVIAGPAEGWKLNALGEAVGVSTDQPVLLLDDLLVALRSTKAAQVSGISCSIDPSNDGLARSAALIKRLTNPGDNIQPILDQLEEAVGPQTITVKGVPTTSHFARVLVAADYRMKRIAMGFEQSPIHELPSYLSMVKSARGANMFPRWWLEPKFDAIVGDADGLAFEFRDIGVKAMTEDQFLDANGQRRATGKSDGLARKWSDLMTAHYEELSQRDAIFGQLRNCIDMAVLAALIAKENLPEKSGWNMSLLVSDEIPVESYYAPQQVDSQASALRHKGAWVLSVSGGILINPFAPLASVETSGELASLRDRAAAPANAWYWN